MADGDEYYVNLYADDIESQSDSITDTLDLYDVVFEPTTKTAAKNSKTQSESAIDNEKNITTKDNKIEIRENRIFHYIQEKPHDNNGSTYQLYIGNLTWWTNKDEIIDAIRKIGVNDFQKIKLFEDPKNSKSKGFCYVSISSEDSMKLCLNDLPKTQIHGQNPMVTVATKHTLNYFERKFDTIANNCSLNREQNFYLLPNMQVPAPPICHGSPIMQQPPTRHELSHHSHSQPINKYDMQHNKQISSEEKYKEMLEKIKSAANLAISNAKRDIKEKNYTSAKNTLHSAISLIKISRVADDIRCKLLISSLEDTLDDIIRNYSRSRSSNRFKRRSRSKENDRYGNQNIRRPKERHDYREYESRDSEHRREKEDKNDYSRKIENGRKKSNKRRASDAEKRRYKLKKLNIA